MLNAECYFRKKLSGYNASNELFRTVVGNRRLAQRWRSGNPGAGVQLAPDSTWLVVRGHAGREHRRESLHRCRVEERSRGRGHRLPTRAAKAWNALGRGSPWTPGAGALERELLRTSGGTAAD